MNRRTLLAGAIGAICGTLIPRRSSLSPADYTWSEERLTFKGVPIYWDNELEHDGVNFVAVDPAVAFDRSCLTWWSQHNGELVLRGVEYDVERMERLYKRCLDGGDQPNWIRVSDRFVAEFGDDIVYLTSDGTRVISGPLQENRHG